MVDASTQSKLPNILVIGAAKAATTTFAADLSQCSDIAVPEVKEPHYLCNNGDPESLASRYCDLYGASSKKKFRVDASTGYSKLHEFPGIAEIAKNILSSEAQIVYLVRDPIERAKSHHLHLMRRKRIPSELGEACLQDPGIVECGKYYQQLQPWLEHFDEENVHVFVMEEFVKNRTQTINAFLTKIGATSIANLDEKITHNVGNSRNVSKWGLGEITFRLMSSPVYKRYIRDALGSNFRGILKRILMKEPDAVPTCHDSSIEYLFNECRDDWKQFIAWFGRQPTSWNLEQLDGINTTSDSLPQK